MDPNQPQLSSVIFRSPLVSIQGLTALFDASLKSPNYDSLFAFYQQPWVREALYLASPSLYAQWEDWQRHPTELPRKGVLMALLKYASRMSSRCTPFGLFSGVGWLSLSPTTELSRGLQSLRPHTRLDGNGLVQLYDRLMADSVFRSRLRYRANDSFYAIGQEWRYSEFTKNTATRQVQISALTSSPVLEGLIPYAASYRSYAQLIHRVQALAEATPQQATDYVDSLVEASVLLAELEPNVTGRAYGQRLTDALRAMAAQHPTENQPDSGEVNELIDGYLALAVPQGVSLTTGNCKAVDEWFSDQQFATEDQQSFLHTNLYFEVPSARLSQSAATTIQQQVTQLAGLFMRPQPPWLTQFKTRFYDRYQSRPVGLLEALDPDIGVGIQPPTAFEVVDNRLLQQIMAALPDPVPEAGQGSSLDPLRQQLLLDSANAPYTPCQLPAQALASFLAVVPTSFSMLGCLLAGDAGAIDRGDFTFLLRSVQGPSSAMLLGRFCLDSPELTAQVTRELYEEEAQRPQVLIAEIAHLTGGRAANVNARPTLRRYEIPYLTPSSVDADHTIELSDLQLYMSSPTRLTLYSKRLGKAIIPRLTTAHNTAIGDDVYRFLTQIGYEDDALAGSWSWGRYAQRPYLPRLVFGKLIVSRAQWRISRSDLLALSPDFAQALALFSRQHQMPSRLVLLSAGTDNELLIDTRLPLFIDLLDSQLTTYAHLTLIEWVNGPDQCWVRGEDQQTYAQELILSVNTRPAPAHVTLAEVVLPTPLPPSVNRDVLVGGDWLYTKWYTGHQAGETLLSGYIAPLLEEFTREGWMVDWFFIRYYDPEFHLRIRIRRNKAHEHPALALGMMLEALHQMSLKAREQGLVSRLQLDTYQREIERYGHHTIDDCETLFYHDSEAWLGFLRQHPFPSPDERLRYGLQSSVALLGDAGMSIPQARAFMAGRQSSYLAEFGDQKSLRAALNASYRDYYPQLAEWLGGQESPLGYEPLFAARSATTATSWQRLIQTDHGVNHPFSGTSGLASVLHMAMNRVFVSRFRENELIVYHFLARYYQSLAARQKA